MGLRSNKTARLETYVEAANVKSTAERVSLARSRRIYLANVRRISLSCHMRVFSLPGAKMYKWRGAPFEIVEAYILRPAAVQSPTRKK